jgi:cell division protein FtsL
MEKKLKITIRDILIIILFLVIIYLIYKDYSVNSKYVSLKNRIQTHSSSLVPKI